MPDKQKKPKSPKQGATASNLLASMPWLTKKTFLIPALASVLVVSLVGVVLAIQGSNSARSDEEIVEVPQAEPELEIAAEPVIGAACVEGEPVCEFVKTYLLSDFGWEWVGFYEHFIDYVVEFNSISRASAEDVVAAVEFDWCAETTRVIVQPSKICGEASPESGSAGPGGSQGSALAPRVPDTAPSAPPVPVVTASTPADTARIYMDSWSSSSYANSRLVSINNLVSLFNLSREDATAGLDSLNVNWSLNAAKAARYFEAQSFTDKMSRRGWIRMLNERDLFTQSEAEYAVDSLGIDWSVNASRAAVFILEFFDCDFFVEDSELGQTALVDDVASYIMGTFGFTEDEAYSSAMGQLELEGDWVWKPLANCAP